MSLLLPHEFLFPIIDMIVAKVRMVKLTESLYVLAITCYLHVLALDMGPRCANVQKRQMHL